MASTRAPERSARESSVCGISGNLCLGCLLFWMNSLFVVTKVSISLQGSIQNVSIIRNFMQICKLGFANVRMCRTMCECAGQCANVQMCECRMLCVNVAFAYGGDVFKTSRSTRCAAPSRTVLRAAPGTSRSTSRRRRDPHALRTQNRP